MAQIKPFKIGYDKINGIPFHEAIKAAQQRDVVLPDVYYGDLQGLARQLAFSVAGIAALDQLENVKNSLSAALQRGESQQKWSKEVLESGVLELPDYRLDNIFRTNIQNSYNRGRWERFQRTKATRPYLMYDAINDSRVRPHHLAMDGVIRQVDDPLWNTWSPACGYRCRCRLISLSEKQALARSGQGKGINKPIPGDVQPDEGWDYNPGADLTVGVKRAFNKRPDSDIKAVIPAKVDSYIGKPVSDAFTLPKKGKTKTTADYVLDHINKIHGDGDLPVIPIKSSAAKSYQGAYVYKRLSGDSVSINLSNTSRNPELTIAHEIGHFLDHNSMALANKKPDARWGSWDNPLFDNWRKAIDDTQETKNLLFLKSINADYADYYLERHEQWARSYAQWLALRSKDPLMTEQVQIIVEQREFSPEPYGFSQWNDESFEPIAKTIDEIFRSLGWMK